MPDYRIYFLDEAGHVSKPPVVLSRDNDDQAKASTTAYVDGMDAELWEGARMVAKFARQ